MLGKEAIWGNLAQTLAKEIKTAEAIGNPDREALKGGSIPQKCNDPSTHGKAHTDCPKTRNLLRYPSPYISFGNPVAEAFSKVMFIFKNCLSECQDVLLKSIDSIAIKISRDGLFDLLYYT